VCKREREREFVCVCDRESTREIELELVEQKKEMGEPERQGEIDGIAREQGERSWGVRERDSEGASERDTQTSTQRMADRQIDKKMVSDGQAERRRG